MAGAKSLYYYQYPLQWYPAYPRYPLPQMRDCGLFGCIDDTASSIRQGAARLLTVINDLFCLSILIYENEQEHPPLVAASSVE